MAKIRIDGYVHSDKETMQDLGERAGLTGEALKQFRYALYEVKVPMLVDTETGEYEIVKNEVTG
jgi:hypothetical protein